MIMPFHRATLILNPKFYQPFGNRTTANSLQIHIIIKGKGDLQMQNCAKLKFVVFSFVVKEKAL